MERVDVFDETTPFVMMPVPVLEALDGSPKAAMLYLWLKKYANYKTGVSHPSRKTLARHLGFKTSKSIDPVLSELKEVGVLHIFPRYRNEHGAISYERDDEFTEQTSNGYRLVDLPTPSNTDTPLVPVDTPPPGYADTLPQGTEVPTNIDPRDLDPGELDPSSSAQPTAAPAAKGKKPKRENHEVPDGWMPSQKTIDRIREQRPDLDLAAEHENFMDYWQSITGAKARKADWDKTWAVWMRRQPKRRQPVRPQNFMDALRASRQAETQTGATALPEAARGELTW